MWSNWFGSTFMDMGFISVVGGKGKGELAGNNLLLDHN